MSLKSIINDFHGDTIVEVMVVLAILGSGIAISYSSVSRSLAMSQDAKERMEVTQLLQTQLEYVREAVLNPSSSLGVSMANTTSQSGSMFCFYVSQPPNTIEIYQFSPIDIINANKTNPTYPTDCSQGFFGYYITYTTNSNSHIYEAKSSWPSILGNGQNKANIIYEVYAPVQ